ncbi:MAG TPA: hypothetical protein VFM18_22175 [Methanosarcina sp.]|nr:hypothetical protein [Methanosarcina sp.]
MRIEVDFEGNITEHEDAPIVEPSAEEIQAQINQDSLSYLASTDWYVVRFSETGVAIPDAVKAKRQESRDAIK